MGDKSPESVCLSVRLSVCLSVRPFVCALTAEPFDLRPSSFAWGSTLTLARSRSNAKNQVFTRPLPCFKVNVIGWVAAVDNRGSALPHAAKSNKSHYQFKVFVCVSVISERMQILARMQSIGVLI